MEYDKGTGFLNIEEKLHLLTSRFEKLQIDQLLINTLLKDISSTQVCELYIPQIAHDSVVFLFDFVSDNILKAKYAVTLNKTILIKNKLDLFSNDVFSELTRHKKELISLKLLEQSCVLENTLDYILKTYNQKSILSGASFEDNKLSILGYKINVANWQLSYGICFV